jgi:multidrug resistance efflux pump
MPETPDANDSVDPEFTARLEWQVRTALRRTSRFARPARGAWRVAKLAKSATIVVVALTAGASATLAIQRVQESRSAQLHGHIASLELARAETRQMRRAETLKRIDAAVARGRESTGARAEAELAAARSAGDVRRRKLDLEETTAGGRAPDDTLAAPRVGGRDFVGERLAVDLSECGSALLMAQSDGKRVQQLVDAGAASTAELSATRAAVARAESDVTRTRARADLRVRFLSGEISAARVEWLGRIADNEAATIRRAAELEQAKAHVERSRALGAGGFAPQSDVAAAELAFADAQAELLILRDERALLDEELAAAH